MANEVPKIWLQPERPFWYPDTKGFIVGSILIACIALAFFRMFRPLSVDDKILDMMVTILFSTCLVTIINYFFGSSGSSEKKDDAIVKVAVGNDGHPPNGTGPGAVAAAALAAAPAAAAEAAPPAAEAAAPAAAEAAVAEALAKAGAEPSLPEDHTAPKT